MTTLTDAFSRADTGVGVGLGTAPSGLVWSQTNGQWQIVSNKAYTPTVSTSNPVATVASTANVDVSISVSSVGGDALYLRVVDANNWYRLRVENDTYTYVSGTHQEAYQYASGSHQESYQTPSQWRCVLEYYNHGAFLYSSPGQLYNSTSDPSVINYNTDGTRANRVSACEVSAYTTTTVTVTDYSTGYNTITDYTTSYIYKVIFEKCMAGVVYLLATYVVASPTTSLRVVVFASDYRVFINGATSLVGIITDSTFSTAIKHGVGRGGQNTANSGSALDDFSITVIEAPPAATALTPASGSTVSTGKPTVGLTLNAPSSGQKFKGQWQFATDSAFTTDVITVTESDSDLRSITGTTTEVLTEVTRLTKEGLWYLRGRTIDEYGVGGPWTSLNTVTVDIPAPATPTGVIPVNGAILNTDTSVIEATLPAASDGQKVKAEWQFATDAGFTANVKTVTEPDTALKLSGSSIYTIPNADQLFQTVWYYRARSVDQYGQHSAYSTATTFTITHPPSTSGYSPTGSVSISYAATTAFGWTFDDTSPTDTQTAYQIIIERNDTSALVLDTGKIASVVLNPALAIGAGLKDIQLRWKIRVWDTDDVVGNYGSYNLFKVSDGPVVTIVSPADGSDVNSSRPILDWTFTASGGRAQASYRITYTKFGDSLPTLDTGVVASAAVTFNPSPESIRIMNGEIYVIAITVADLYGLLATDSITITAVYAVPATVIFTADGSNFASLGYVQLTWLNYVYDSGFLRWRVYRRIAGAADWTIIKEILQNGVNAYRDWIVPANTTYEYNVTQIVDRFGEEIESLTPVPPTFVIVAGGDYWLIDPVDSNNNCKLSHVKEDGYTDMYEMSEYTIVGRGRHVDYGESIGKSGSLSAQLRDSAGSTARVKKQVIEGLKKKRIPVILRNPFGDIYNVALGDIAVSRIAGTGTAEFCDITVPYLEIF